MGPMDVVEVRPRPSRVRSLGLVAAGLVAGLVLATLTTADAQTPTPKPGASSEVKPDRGPRPDKDKMRGHGRGAKLGHHALHGEFTVRGRDGAFRTLAMQQGEATAVSATSITVRSEDGFSRTYARTAETKVSDGVAVGAQVRVLAVVENGGARALHVREGRGHEKPEPAT